MEQNITLEWLMSVNRVGVLSPEIILSVFALAVLLVAAFFPEYSQRRVLPLLALVGTACTALACLTLWGRNLAFGPTDRAIYVVDDFALFFKWTFLIGLAVTVMISTRFLTARTGDRHTVIGEYYGLLMLSTVGMMMVAGAHDLLVIFLGIETFSIALYILAGFARARLMSNEAALKYFLLGAFATGFLLYGIALIYLATGSTYLPDIAAASAKIGTASLGEGISSSGVLFVGMALVLIGLGFKAALVPFHQWTPDVYEGSPTPVTAFMAVGAKAAAFAAIIRVFPGTFGAAGVSPQWHHILLVIAVLTMTVGNVVAIAQDSLKRMLAYSSIAHAGYVLMGVLAAGAALRQVPPQNDDAIQSIAAVLFYLVVYTLMNLGGFALLVYLENQRAAQNPVDDSEDANIRVGDLRGLAWRQPLAAAALTVFMLSLAGIPPTAGFFGKLYIFQESVLQNMVGLAIVGALNSVISVYYYLRPVVEMYMHGDAEPAGMVVAGDGTAAVVASPTAGLSIAVTVAVGICAALVLFMIVLQGVAFEWAQQAANIKMGLAG